MIEEPKTLAPVAPHWLARWSGAAAMLVGVLVLVVRIIDVPLLTELESEWVTMRANTALCFALCGAGLCLLQTQDRHTRRAVRVCAAIVGGIALLTLAEYASGWNSGIGAFFLGDYAASLRPGRMGPNSALCFALMAAGLWLMSRPAGNASRPLVLGWLGSIVAVIGLIALLGHVAGFKLGYGWWSPTVTTVLTASLLVLLGASLLVSAWREAGVRWLIEPWISAGFAVGLALLVVVSAISHRSTERLVKAADRVKHTHKILAKLSGLRRALDEHQSGMSGFVITGNDSFLPLSQDVILQALKQVRVLRELTSDNPGQQRQLAILETQIDERLQLVRTMIELRRSLGLDEAAAQIASGTGKATMDAIRVRLDEMEAEEERLLQDRAAESQAATTMLPVGTVLSLVLLASGLLRLNGVMAQRQRGTDALQRSDHRLRLALDAAQMGSWDWDLLTGEILWTPYHEILFGYEPGTPLRSYADFHNRMHPDDVERVEARVQACLANRTDFHCEFRVVWPDGSCHWISGLGRFFFDSAGRPSRMLGMVRDITVRKRAEEEIRRLNAELERRVEERTRELQAANATLTDFKAALDEHALVAITCPNGKITYVNDKFCKVSKYSRAELLGQDHRIVNSGYHSKAFMRDLWQTIVGGRTWKGEVKNRAKDGTFYWVDTTIVPFLGEGGKPAQFIAIRTDISARKEAEAALELNDFCVRQASLAIFWVAPDARILRVNPAVSELLGYTEAELLNMAITDLDPAFHAERWPSHWLELRELKRMSFETSHQHKDGHLIPIEVDLNWLEFEGREYNFAFVRDVTARKAAEEEIGKLNAGLQSRAARLEIAVAELDAFSYSVAHDLRAPLRAVDGFSRMVFKYQAARLDDNGRRMLGAIRSETQRMARLIDDLLAFSRLGRQQIQPAPIDMHAMAREVFDELAALEPERKLRLDLQELPPASGTPEMIRQVWVNLIANAIKFTKDRETGEIEIGTREDGKGGREYFVKDNGAGFDTRHAGKLFGVFQRLHSQQEFPGTGVGLALVQRIVQRHGGRARAEAEVNRGATFYFTLASPENLSIEISHYDR